MKHDSNFLNPVNRSESDPSSNAQPSRPLSSSLERSIASIVSHLKVSDCNDVAMPDTALVSVSSIQRSSFCVELLQSTEHIFFQSRLSLLMTLGPIAIVGDSFGLLGEELSFLMAGIALIPCAERLSFLTEQVAEHTNATIGALLNATFGNAPELLISIAALRSGYYRVVQLAMLGSMLTNLMLVFGIACIIGGCRYQIQHIRQASGNVSVILLLVATAGSLFPAALVLSGQFPSPSANSEDAQLPPVENEDTFHTRKNNLPSQEEVTLCRVNAVVMLVLYFCYLVFQLGTHKGEFDDDEREQEKGSAPRNVACQKFGHSCLNLFWTSSATARRKVFNYSHIETNDLECNNENLHNSGQLGDHCVPVTGEDDELESLTDHDVEGFHTSFEGMPLDSHHTGAIPVAHPTISTPQNRRRKRPGFGDEEENDYSTSAIHRRTVAGDISSTKSKNSDAAIMIDNDVEDDDESNEDSVGHAANSNSHDIYRGITSLEGQIHASRATDNCDFHKHGPIISLRVSIAWLFIMTLCISAMSDILVDTIDGFAGAMHLSEVFTSMVIIPFFSNVAEQVSAFLFAYRNEMDLCVGVTVGSAIQIATFVLPGSVVIGMFLDRNMTLYFHSFETVCLFFGVVVVAAILQNGTTNWLVGAMLVGIYIMFAAGIWFHEKEVLNVDADIASST